MIDFRNFFLREQIESKLVVIFAGRFQPFHKGHKKLYDIAKTKFPNASFFVATSDTNPKLAAKEPERYPFSFQEKKQIIEATGIPANEIVQTAQPYKPVEILQHFNSNTDKVIFLVGEKDMKEDPRFAFTPTKLGAPSYFQPFKSVNDMVSFSPDGGHGYIYAPGTITFSIDGKSVTSASELRREFKEGDDKKRQRIVIDVLGKPDKSIYDLFVSKLVA
jgi:cytidyltransferase-like protein